MDTTECYSLSLCGLLIQVRKASQFRKQTSSDNRQNVSTEMPICPVDLLRYAEYLAILSTSDDLPRYISLANRFLRWTVCFVRLAHMLPPHMFPPHWSLWSACTGIAFCCHHCSAEDPQPGVRRDSQTAGMVFTKKKLLTKGSLLTNAARSVQQ